MIDKRKTTLPELNDNPDDPIGRYGIPGYFSLAQFHRLTPEQRRKVDDAIRAEMKERIGSQ